MLRKHNSHFLPVREENGMTIRSRPATTLSPSPSQQVLSGVVKFRPFTAFAVFDHVIELVAEFFDVVGRVFNCGAEEAVDEVGGA